MIGKDIFAWGIVFCLLVSIPVSASECFNKASSFEIVNRNFNDYSNLINENTFIYEFPEEFTLEEPIIYSNVHNKKVVQYSKAINMVLTSNVDNPQEHDEEKFNIDFRGEYPLIDSEGYYNIFIQDSIYGVQILNDSEIMNIQFFTYYHKKVIDEVIIGEDLVSKIDPSIDVSNFTLFAKVQPVIKNNTISFIVPIEIRLQNSSRLLYIGNILLHKEERDKFKINVYALSSEIWPTAEPPNIQQVFDVQNEDVIMDYNGNLYYLNSTSNQITKYDTFKTLPFDFDGDTVVFFKENTLTFYELNGKFRSSLSLYYEWLRSDILIDGILYTFSLEALDLTEVCTSPTSILFAILWILPLIGYLRKVGKI